MIMISGGSSGIGLSTVNKLEALGCKVYELSRSGKSHGNVTHIDCDVTKEEQLVLAAKEVFEKENRIDVLINCAGFGISGAVEFTEIEDAKRQLDVNFFGGIRAVKAVLPYMRKQKSGRIVNISSVAAPVSIPFQAYYSVSKAAINSITLSLANELRPFGITVCAVMPGDIRSGFTSAREKFHKGNDVYGGIIDKAVANMEKDERNGMSPDTAGAYIAKIALKTNHKPLYAIGFSYKLAVLIVKLLPARLANYLVSKLYT